ncbi:hypothetical protein THAOC_21180 [Thalassiosira oceanica]|uniref:Uncharacterized protein n=1 Tax=Thalassiosira oceanica TaxID=159749 RepID=K0SJP4_THAOC|nr:hypothetical protein THAOC_21180 [Thalassiosira oceanica]|eukprot:EJK58677.1 hypothetical protein THAOC_21180 [Thalassiosira oceanica]
MVVEDHTGDESDAEQQQEQQQQAYHNEEEVVLDLSSNDAIKKYQDCFCSEKEEIVEMLHRVTDSEGDKPPEPEYVPSKIPETCLYKSETLQLTSGSSHSVFFVMKNDELTKLNGLTVTLVYRGSFSGGNSVYIPGALSVQLSAYSPSMTQRAVGTVTQVRQNTEDQLGLFVLRHNSEDEDILADSLFEVEITAARQTCFSLQANGTFAGEIRCEAQRDMAELVFTARGLINCHSDLAMLKKQHFLACRKYELHGRLKDSSIEQKEQIESELDSLDLKLDFRDEMRDGGAAVEAEIRSLKNRHVKLAATVSLRYGSS